jgi:rare lipoprotein A (RlpA)-like double-psi beta-barrel protein
VVVTVNDRGPFIRGRVLDLSTAAARAVGLTSAGIALVTAEVISLSDDAWGAAARKSTGTRFGLERLQTVSKQGECRGNDLYRASSPGNIVRPEAHSSGGVAPERTERRWPYRRDSPPEILEAALVATTPRPYRRISPRKEPTRTPRSSISRGGQQKRISSASSIDLISSPMKRRARRSHRYGAAANRVLLRRLQAT